ncbi:MULTISPECIES: GDYXXLXY domain-containing protein [unclassified Cupriavidus]|uniref:GDYXXLXY domain-containing protein n=1 Tax=unclassified Cupriavidus TaxID=2640874 RepID=UPI001BFFF7D0|nr:MULTISPECIES: GDYXXLXY domain-containing protein [unclassified Cupriavidus]MCA3193163.1 GDYXXLXY domain-containing protein [Cupriavidus sp.]MCA3194743.1 GDYXXLXY domain-containing protein [Cupriavidus sp.]MCA3202989.1 GDYXXLXY domain-containing protein [Cupriavidus sp.]MCA3206915.1 GDYXXLXY domain-containing protein [Cupriavidus sp.]MCA3232460.1 GDYXXLXY domain-containing protein [Cupriavidus sp.]
MKRWIIVGWLLTIGVALAGTVGKERLMARGDVVYLRLAPVDPRSLMQGDYMALNFSVANEVRAAHGTEQSRLAREEVIVVRRDDRNEGHFVRLYHGEPLATGEMLLRVQNVPSRWGGNGVQVSTDAWFFQEGQAERYAKAKFGEFRVDADGQALLVGMRDEALAPM